MPEPLRSEEDENRRNSLCLFGVLGITKLNRCDSCPGATRSPLQHLRCPLDDAQPNIFRPPVDPVNSLASSSGKGKEPETELIYQAQKLSLADPTASGSCCATSGVPSQEDVVSKRILEKYEKHIQGPEFRDQSPHDWTINKPPRPLVDAPPNKRAPRPLEDSPNKRLRQMMQNSELEIMPDQEHQNPEHQVMQKLEGLLMQNSEEHHSAGRASTSTNIAFVPGFSMDPDVGVYSSRYDVGIKDPK